MKILRKSGLVLLAVAFSCNIMLSSEYRWYNPRRYMPSVSPFGGLGMGITRGYIEGAGLGGLGLGLGGIYSDSFYSSMSGLIAMFLAGLAKEVAMSDARSIINTALQGNKIDIDLLIEALESYPEVISRLAYVDVYHSDESREFRNVVQAAIESLKKNKTQDNVKITMDQIKTARNAFNKAFQSLTPLLQNILGGASSFR